MAGHALVDAGFLVALLSRRDTHHRWAAATSRRHVPPWRTCEAALSEALHLLGPPGTRHIRELIRREALGVDFELSAHVEPVFGLMEKYADVPASLADACLVRMTETLSDPILLTTDTDFRIYRRHGRQVVPCVFPS